MSKILQRSQKRRPDPFAALLRRQERFDSVIGIIAAIALVVFICATATGCSTVIVPNTVSPFVEHLSHVTQHPPFTSDPQNCGADIVGVSAGWRLGDHFRLDVSDGIALERHYRAAPGYQDGSYGELIGPNREQFEARLSYAFKTRP